MKKLFSSKRGMIWSLFFLFLQAVALVWINTERIELAYSITKNQQIVSEKQALASKLELEKNNLLAPYRLEKLAEEFGLKTPGQDQLHILQ